MNILLGRKKERKKEGEGESGGSGGGKIKKYKEFKRKMMYVINLLIFAFSMIKKYIYGKKVFNSFLFNIIHSFILYFN